MAIEAALKIGGGTAMNVGNFKPTSIVTYSALLFLITSTLFGSLYLCWHLGFYQHYYGIIRFFGVDPWTEPFLDLRTVLSWSECHHLGYDVLKKNPCDPFNSLLNYAPTVRFLPLNTRETQLIGLIQSLLFLISVPFVIKPASKTELGLALLVSASPASLFALERGNIDLFEFYLIAMTGLLITRGRIGSVISYAIFYIGGLLKFYAFALLLIVAKERVRTFIVYALVALLALVVFFVHYRADLILISGRLPGFSFNSDTFGSQLLPFGLMEIFALSRIGGIALYLSMTAGSIVISALLVRWALWKKMDINWSSASYYYFLAGAILLTGCFFLQTNENYRGVFLILSLGGLLELRKTCRENPVRRICIVTIAVLIFCAWSDFIRHLVSDFGISNFNKVVSPDTEHQDGLLTTFSFLFFVVRELAWWWLVCFYMAAISIFMLSAPIGQKLLRIIPLLSGAGRRRSPSISLRDVEE